MTCYWISWYESDPHGDFRPFKLPLPKAIKGWWCSGSTAEDQPRFTICAHVEADNEDTAKKILAGFWGLGEFRFVHRVAPDWTPNPGRFPPHGGAAK